MEGVRESIRESLSENYQWQKSDRLVFQEIELAAWSRKMQQKT